MDVATGAMGSLLLKLGDLLADEYKLHAKLKEDVQYLKTELTSMYPALRKVGHVRRDQLDEQVKIWADEARDLSYRMEDTVDKFLVRVEGLEPDVGKLESLMKEMCGLLAKGKIHHNKIEDIKASEVSANSPGATTVDPCILALYKDQKQLGGVHYSLKELTELLSDWDEDDSKQLRTLSIVGFKGLGKTTVAKAVYDTLHAEFDCSAFVPVGRNPGVQKLLNDILFAINKQMYPGMDERQLIDKLRGSLENKRYFIVIDDLWDTSVWDIIMCACKHNNCRSRIITTTRILGVAKMTDLVYRLRPLSDESALELLNTRLSGGKNKWSYDQQEGLCIILKHCQGLPIAITMMASLLVGKPVDSWSKVVSSIRSQDYDTSFGDLLACCYDDLPYHLRTCLLHLSTYPEDRFIEKDSLIWKWAAEGFIHKNEEVGLYEIGERYFSELINRSMIQLVERPQIDGIIIGCRVHNVVLDIICSMAKEENFVTVLDRYEEQYSSDANARRLAVGRRIGNLPSTCMHQVRSFNAICFDESMPSLSCFQVLRVLALEGDILSKQNTNCLENIGKLVHLRYLGLGKMVDVLELPKEIGDLKFLQALDLGCDTLEELPQSVCQLRQLKCLRFDGTRARVPDWIGNLTSLEELLLGSVNRPSNFVSEVGKLTELRKLRISGCLWLNSVSSVKAWAGSLVKLQKIKVLDIHRVYFDILSSC